MPKRGLLKGKKINQKHSSVTDAAICVVKAAKEHPNVTKIVIGQIKRIVGGPRRLIIKKIDAGLSVKVRGGNTLQQLYVYTFEPEQVQKVIEDVWN